MQSRSAPAQVRAQRRRHAPYLGEDRQKIVRALAFRAQHVMKGNLNIRQG